MRQEACPSSAGEKVRDELVQYHTVQPISNMTLPCRSADSTYTTPRRHSWPTMQSDTVRRLLMASIEFHPSRTSNGINQQEARLKKLYPYCDEGLANNTPLSARGDHSEWSQGKTGEAVHLRVRGILHYCREVNLLFGRPIPNHTTDERLRYHLRSQIVRQKILDLVQDPLWKSLRIQHHQRRQSSSFWTLRHVRSVACRCRRCHLPTQSQTMVWRT